MLSLQLAWGVICVSDTKILLHSLLSLCFCPASMIQALPGGPACHEQHSSSTMGERLWTLPQCPSSSSHLAEPVLLGSVCSSHGIPCCWLYISLNTNPFHTSGKIPMRNSVLLDLLGWAAGSGRGRQGWDQDWSPNSFSIPGAELLCCVQPMFLGWKMGLLFGCCGQSHWAVFPDSQPASVLVPPLFLGVSHPWWRLWRREPSPSPCCALSLCSAPMHPSLLSQIIFATSGLWDLLLYTLQSKEQTGMLLALGECPSPPAAVEGAGRSWGCTPDLSSSFWVLCRAPLSPVRWLWPGCSRPSPQGCL